MALPLLLGLLAVCLAAVLGVAALGVESGTAKSGVNQIAAFYAATNSEAPAADAAAQPLSPLLARLQKLAIRLSPASSTIRLQRNLDRAGNPGRWNLARILAFKTIAMVAVGAFGLLIGVSHGTSVIFFVIAAAAGGFMVPNLLIYNLGLKRQEKMQKELPDAMDMMTVCMEAGLGFDAALARVARNTKGALANEFARSLQEMQFGMSRTEALKALAARTTVPELRTLVSALVQAALLGIPVAAVMREQAADMRLKRRQRAEEKAQKVTVKILFPLIFCLLPALFIVVIGPGVLTIMKSFSGV
jgi:tight adherence protein C